MPALTVDDLSRRLGVSPRRVKELMHDDAARGLVVIDRSGRWRLTAAAELEFGHTLRGISELSTAPRRGPRALPDVGPYAADGPQGNLDSLATWIDNDTRAGRRHVAQTR